MRDLQRRCIIPIIILTFYGCGYHLVGQGNSLPEHIKKISVPIFQNRSYEYGLENVLTEEVANSLNRRAGIDVEKNMDHADAVLEGEIVDYRYVPTLNSQRKVTQYYIQITASVRLRDLVKDLIYWEEKGFVFHQIYKVTGDLASNQENRRQAWEDAAEGFAESLSSVLLEGF